MCGIRSQRDSLHKSPPLWGTGDCEFLGRRAWPAMIYLVIYLSKVFYLLLSCVSCVNFSTRFTFRKTGVDMKGVSMSHEPVAYPPRLADH